MKGSLHTVYHAHCFSLTFTLGELEIGGLGRGGGRGKGREGAGFPGAIPPIRDEDRGLKLELSRQCIILPQQKQQTE